MFIRKLLLSTVILFASSISSLAETIVIQSAQNGLYVIPDENGYLMARTDLAHAMRLEFLRLEDGTVAFRNLDDGRYLRAGITSGTYLGWGGTNLGIWQKFHMIQNNGLFYLRSAKNELWVRAGIGQDSILGAVSPVARGWEAFRLIPASVEPVSAEPAIVPQNLEFAGEWRVVNMYDPQGYRLEVNDLTLRLSTFVIGANGLVTINSGCNTITGQIVERGAAHNVENLITTRMACAEPIREFEAEIMSALRDNNLTSYLNSQLLFYARDGVQRLDLQRR